MRVLRINQYPRELRIPTKDGDTEVYRIRWVSRRSRMMPKDTMADCNPSTRVIRIKRGLGRQETFKAFIHEVLHALDFEYPIGMKHKHIYALDDAIFQLLRLNT